MIEATRITQTEARPIAVVHVTVPRERIREVMGPGLEEIRAALAAQGIAPAGPWFTHHLRMDPGVFDFEIGVPVATPVAPAGRVGPGTWPAQRVAYAVYAGGYEGLGAAWGEFGAWIAAGGHTSAPDLWECYVAGPESGPDPAGYRTEFYRPLVG
jgi:effector-binding domain-containing protein